MARTKKPAETKANTETTSPAKGKTKNQETTKKGRLSTAEARREYQRRYYQMHKEKAKEYQRQYNLTHKKKLRSGRGKSGQSAAREVVRSTFNTSDIMHAPIEKTIRILISCSQ